MSITSKLDLDYRVSLPDGREGFVLGILCRPDDTESVDVMTDSYVKVTCRPDQVQVVKRKTGDLEPVDSSPGGNKHRVYPIERTNHERLRRAIWHEHWKRHGNAEDFITGNGSSYDEYARLYLEGKLEPMPVKEDIRAEQVSQRRQLNLFEE